MPALGFNQTLVLVRILGAVNGLGSAFLMVTSFSRAFNNALEAGYEDNTDTSTMVSGTMQSLDLKSLDNDNFQECGRAFSTWAIFLVLREAGF